MTEVADIEMSSMQLDIEANSTKAAQNLDSLVESLKKMKSALKGMEKLNEISESLSAISEKAASIYPVFSSLGEFGKGLQGLKDVDKTIKKIAESFESFKNIDMSGLVSSFASLNLYLKPVADNMERLHIASKGVKENLGGIKMPSISFEDESGSKSKTPNWKTLGASGPDDRQIRESSEGFIPKTFSGMGTAFSKSISFISGKLKSFWQGIANDPEVEASASRWQDSFENAIPKVKNAMSSAFKNLKSWAKDAFTFDKSIFSGIDSFFSEAIPAASFSKPNRIDKPEKTSFDQSKIWNDFKANLAVVSGLIIAKIAPPFEKAFQKVKVAGKKAATEIQGFFLASAKSIQNAFSKIKISLSPIQGILNKIKDAFSTIGNFVKGVFEKTFQVVKKAWSVVGGPIISIGKKMFSSIASFGQRQLSKIWDGLKSAPIKAFKGIGSMLTGAFKSIGNGAKSLASAFGKRFVSSISNAYDKLTNFHKVLARVALYSAVRNVLVGLTEAFKTGIANLYQYSKIMGTEFAPSMDKLATSALYLSNSLGAMAAPLINAIAPAVDYLIDRFVDLINIVGKAFAALTGASVFSQAKKHFKEYEEGANSASKALKSFTLGIDELNIIEPTESGGAGNMEDYGSMFEEVPVEGVDWAKTIREQIEKGDWNGAGSTLANHLNGLIEDFNAEYWGTKLGKKINNGLNLIYGFMTSFNWQGLGATLATFLNSMFATMDWDLLGRTLASKWNAMFEFLYGFITTFDWSAFGSYLATSINAWFDEIDWKFIGNTLNMGIQGLLTSAIVFVKELNWAAIGQDIGDMLNEFNWSLIFSSIGVLLTESIHGAFTAVNEFITTFDWSALGTGVADGINSIGWDTIATDLSTFINNSFTAAYNAIHEFLVNMDWEGFGTSIANFLNEIDWITIASQFADNLSLAFNGIVSTIDKVLTETDWAAIGESIGTFIKDMVTNIDWGQLIQTIQDLFGSLREILEGLIDGIFGEDSTIGNILKAFFFSVPEAFNGLVDFVKNVFTGDWEGAWQTIKDTVSGMMDLVLAVFGTSTEDLQKKFSDWWEDVKEWFTIDKWKQIGKDAIEGLFNALGGAWEKIKSWGGTFIDKVKERFHIHSPSKDFQEIGGYLMEGLDKGMNSMGNMPNKFADILLNQMMATANKFAQQTADLMNSILVQYNESLSSANAATQSFSNMALSTFNGLKLQLSSMMNITVGELNKNLATATQSINKFVKDASTSLNDMTKAFQESNKTISSEIGKMFDSANEKISGVTSAIRKNFEDMKLASSSAIATIKRELDSIPRSIQTTHTIVTVHETIEKTVKDTSSGSSSKSSGSKTSGSTAKVSKRAEGGFPETGTFFFASEKGPEIVGKLNNRTAVANEGQIIEGIKSGVEVANLDVVAALYQLIEIAEQIYEKESVVKLDPKSAAIASKQPSTSGYNLGLKS